ncbi:S24 family peptidase [Pseudomonas savastanoi pv. phaseolicola]|uniref:Cro/CI family transcriptional regulator n=4 Tax=Pseudomonas savastanoi TaxID=29438 RepID=A0A3M3FAH9_PSESG|nr:MULTISPECIES: XRE family transcriptional regulator [Pseudomonas]AAZ35779.1 transcriptional regulator, Cro/CI family [Pseudomonas savastanoi pv. phaseolicola 1448A]KPY10095.1 Transcriptional regulator, Cro/CI family [Pseudomonas savastanoi pv. phaseolicola]MBN3469314.1 helix-turn-helix transcriptional regulator [Pseudomonas savastanoi pv. phaseolicola]MBN3476298.1 helix-turn-helix transcriptional regulator [Pseudomonas savastanoi pv. phaseolicola]MBN4177647.1 HTH-type transcriptional regulat
MNTSGDRLRILLRECHLTATDFAANRKITPQHVNNWFKRGVPMARIDEVAELLTVNARWLRTGDGPKHPNESANENTGDDTRMVIQQTRNVLRGDVEIQIYTEVESTHGVGKTVLSEAPGQKIRLPLQVLQTMGIDPKNCMCVAMVGNSMADKIQDGSILGVDRELTQVIDGEIYALEHGGILRVRYLYRMPNGGLRLRSHNDAEYPDELFSAEDIDREKIRILGWIFWWSTLNSRRNAMLLL